MSEDDFKIESVNMAQAMHVLADVVSAYVSVLMIKQDSSAEDLKKLHQLAIAVFLNSLLSRSQDKPTMVKILHAVADQLQSESAS